MWVVRVQASIAVISMVLALTLAKKDELSQGLYFLGIGSFDKAQAELEDAVFLGGGLTFRANLDARLVHLLARVYYEQGFVVPAYDMIQRFLDLDLAPVTPQTKAKLLGIQGVILKERSAKRLAEEKFKAALEADAKHICSLQNLISLKSDENDQVELSDREVEERNNEESELRLRLLSSPPSDFEDFECRGWAHLEIGENAAAQEWLSKAIISNPGRKSLYSARAMLKYESKDYAGFKKDVAVLTAMGGRGLAEFDVVFSLLDYLDQGSVGNNLKEL